MRPILQTLAAVSLAGASLATAAAPLVFDEAISGDVDTAGVLALDVGVNTITGTSRLLLVSPDVFDDDTDVANLSLAPGLSVVAATVQASLRDPIGILAFETFWGLSTTGQPLSGTCLALLNPTYCDNAGPIAAFDNLPKSGSNLTVAHGFFMQGAPRAYPQGSSVDYTVTLHVASTVPEPASIALMMAGLGLVGGATRRSRRAKG